jgi:hypothetical protein
MKWASWAAGFNRRQALQPWWRERRARSALQGSGHSGEIIVAAVAAAMKRLVA